VHASAAILRYLEAPISVDEFSAIAARKLTVTVASDIKVSQRLEDGSAFIIRDRTASTFSGLAW
jgi:hypothetical protein